jgi:hypothetical protein
LQDVTFALVPFPIQCAGSPFGKWLDDPKQRAEYGGRVIAIADQRIWGSGNDRVEAIEDAGRNSDAPEVAALTCVLLPGDPTMG